MSSNVNGGLGDNSMIILKAALTPTQLREKENKQQDSEDGTKIAPQPRPFVKWVGGKRQMLDILHDAAPAEFGRYYEPFIGGWGIPVFATT